MHGGAVFRGGPRPGPYHPTTYLMAILGAFQGSRRRPYPPPPQTGPRTERPTGTFPSWPSACNPCCLRRVKSGPLVLLRVPAFSGHPPRPDLPNSHLKQAPMGGGISTLPVCQAYAGPFSQASCRLRSYQTPNPKDRAHVCCPASAK